MRHLKSAVLSLFVLVGIALTARADAPKAAADAARADIQATFGFVPAFFKAVPDRALPGAWMEMKTLQMNPNTALPPKIKELIGLAVSAQVPCRYCIYAHTQFAKLGGASDAEIGEAVAVAALARHWSTYLNGIQTDEPKFRSEIARLTENAKKMMAGQMPAPKPMAVTDAKSALADIQQNFGFVPDFLRKFPSGALAGAWTEMRDLELAPETAISNKHKALIGLAVSAQIPCRFCVIADTEFAKLDGATEAEINEAIAMASLVRHWSTILNGLQVDEPMFRKDVDRLIKGAKKMATAPKAR